MFKYCDLCGSKDIDVLSENRYFCNDCCYSHIDTYDVEEEEEGYDDYEDY